LSDPWARSEVLLPLSCAEFDDESTTADAAAGVLTLKREVGDLVAISDALNNLGYDALLFGDYDQALGHLEEAVAIARDLDDTFRLTLAIGTLGLLAVVQERYGEGIRLLRECLLLCIRRGDRRGGSEAVLGLAAATAGLGMDELAVRLDAIQR